MLLWIQKLHLFEYMLEHFVYMNNYKDFSKEDILTEIR